MRKEDSRIQVLGCVGLQECIHSFKYLPSTYYLQSITLGITENTEREPTEFLPLGKIRQTQRNIIEVKMGKSHTENRVQRAVGGCRREKVLFAEGAKGRSHRDVSFGECWDTQAGLGRAGGEGGRPFRQRPMHLHKYGGGRELVRPQEKPPAARAQDELGDRGEKVKGRTSGSNGAEFHIPSSGCTQDTEKL